jgi:hypothetical protein
MLVINSEDITDLDQARETINELQLRLFRSEKCLDDLSRGLEIAYYTRNFESLEQFRIAAEEQLKDRIEFDHPEDDGDPMKITIVK